MLIIVGGVAEDCDVDDSASEASAYSATGSAMLRNLREPEDDEAGGAHSV